MRVPTFQAKGVPRMWAVIALGFLVLWLLGTFILTAAGAAVHLLLGIALIAGAVHIFVTTSR